MAKAKRNKLSRISKEIVGLVEQNGGQRAFAKAVGVSQPLISRIVNGLQEPGEDLLAAISKLPDVNQETFWERASLSTSKESEFLVPIAHALLSSTPASSADELTAETVAVPNAVYRHSLYAIRAKHCYPTFLDPSEGLQPEDLVVIDTSVEKFSKNIRRLDGKLCCVIVESDGCQVITLRRVYAVYDTVTKTWSLKFSSEEKIAELVEAKLSVKKHRKELRHISLDPPDSNPGENFTDTVIELDDISGVAIQLIRNL